MKNDFPRLVVSSEIRRKMLEIAREFRKEATKSEAILWQGSRGKKLDGIKFRRQQPIGTLVVDFYNSAYRLVIEIDGSVHDQQVAIDRARQDILEALGLNILRIKAETVEGNLPIALDMIRSKIAKLKSGEYPSPILGEGLGERVRNDT